MYLVSVVIPVKNGDAWLDETLQAIVEQEVSGDVEIIVIDSGSTDRTAEILKKYPVNVINIPPGEFNHGATRNLGVQHAQGKYVVLTVQDACAVGTHWLQQLLKSFEDESVSAACGQQIIPHDADKNPASWYRPFSKPFTRKYSFTPAEFEALSPEEKRSVCSWDNVNSIYKRQVLLDHPFPVVDFGEDTLWAKNAYLAGLTLMYNPFSQVTHYHLEDPAFVFKREFTQHYHFYKFFGLRPAIPSFFSSVITTLKLIKVLVKEKRLQWKSKVEWLRYNLRVQSAVKKAAQVFYQYLPQGEQALYRQYLILCTRQLQAVKPVRKNEQTTG